MKKNKKINKENKNNKRHKLHNKTKIKNLLINMCLVIFIVMIFLFALEIYFRIKYPMSHLNSNATVQDDYLCLKNKPNTITETKEPEYSYSTTTNSYGFRNQNPNPDASKTIIMIGDSFVYGAGAQDNETMPYVLDELVKTQDSNAEVLNLGGMGAYLAAYYRVLNWSIYNLPKKPDVAIIGVYEWNDIDNQNEALFVNHECPVTVKDGKIVNSVDQGGKTVSGGFTGFMSQHSTLFVMTTRAISRSYFMRNALNRLGIIKDEPIPYYMRIFKTASISQNTSQDADVKKQFEIAEKIIIDMNKLASENNITIIYVALPAKFQVYPESWQMFKSSYHLTDEYTPFSVDSNLKEIFEQTDSKSLSLLDYYYNSTEKDLYYAVDEHPTPKGYEQYANTIYGWLRIEKII